MIFAGFREKEMSRWVNIILIVSSAFVGFIYSLALSFSVERALLTGAGCAGIGYMLMRSRESGYRKVRPSKDLNKIRKGGKRFFTRIREAVRI